MLKTLSTKAKLMLSFFILIIINLCVVAAVVITVNNVQQSAREIEHTLNDAFSRVARIRSVVENTSYFLVASLNPEDQTYNYNSFKNDRQRVLQEFIDSIQQTRPEAVKVDGYAQAVMSLRRDEQDIVNAVNNEVVPLFEQGKYNEAMLVYLKNCYSRFTNMNKTLGNMSTMQARYCITIAKNSADSSTVYIVIALGGLAAIIGMVLATLISNYISRCIGHQVDVLGKLAQGDFTVKMVDSGNKDEFATALNSIRSVRDTLNNTINMTKQKSVELQNEMIYIQKISNDIAAMSGTLQNSALTVAAASDQMVSTTQDIASNCESAATGSNDCRDITQNGLGRVQDSVASIRSQAEHTKDNAAKIESLSRQSNDIGSIVGTIDDIAAQTNLLALNAAIEAARAGEAGRGFAVVADEVRALASRTSESTKEISKMVKNIQDEAKIATESINASVNNMDGVATDAEQIMNILNDITSRVNTVNHQITQIATAAEEQTNATGEISSNMQGATSATQEMANMAHSAKESVESAYNDLVNLNEALNFFKTSAT